MYKVQQAIAKRSARSLLGHLGVDVNLARSDLNSTRPFLLGNCDLNQVISRCEGDVRGRISLELSIDVDLAFAW